MPNNIIKIRVLKRTIVNFQDKLSDGIAQSFHKLFADACSRTMSSEGYIITDIARTLQEKAQIINTVNQLIRHLSETVPEIVQRNYVDTALKYFHECIVIHTDDSDVTKQSDRAFEGDACVRDGSQSTTGSKSVMENRYFVTETTALTKPGHPVRLFSKAWSVESAVFIAGGEFEYTKKAIKTRIEKLGSSDLLMDCGYDNKDVF